MDSFYKRAPGQPTHGKQNLVPRWRITTKEEEHIIYAHWFLNTNPATLYQAPSKNMMLHLIELAGLYCTDKNDDEYDLQQEAIEAADFPNSRYSITSSHPKSKWTKDDFKAGNRKHLEGTNGLNTRRLKIWKDQIFPAIKKSLDQITVSLQTPFHIPGQKSVLSKSLKTRRSNTLRILAPLPPSHSLSVFPFTNMGIVTVGLLLPFSKHLIAILAPCLNLLLPRLCQTYS